MKQAQYAFLYLWAHQTPSLCDTGDTIDCPAQNCPLVGNSECINDQEGLSIYGNPETTTYNSAILATATCVKSFLSSTKKKHRLTRKYIATPSLRKLVIDSGVANCKACMPCSYSQGNLNKHRGRQHKGATD